MEEADRSSRLRELKSIGRAFKLTDKEMVVSIYQGIVGPKRPCGCPSCRARAADQV